MTVRHESGATPTDYTYTGQKSYTADFGLMFYNARWYDPYLNHFTQPDTIVPGAGNPQAWDRYAYVMNNPLRYTDPTGHMNCEEDGYCPVIHTEDYIPGNGGGGGGEPDEPTFESLPINPAEIDGVQWFGGTQNAYLLKKAGEDIYAYCHYFHCGLDILADWGTPVAAGVYGQVVYAGCNSGRSEGPCKVQISVGDYVITYGHLNDIPFVTDWDYVTPDTILGGVGTNSQSGDNSNLPDPNQNFSHIHLEVRGPGKWGGPSINPLQYMSQNDVALLTNIAETQDNSTMSHFYDGTISYSYPPPSDLMPNQIIRYGTDSFFP